MSPIIFITGAAKADCLRIRDVLRRRFRQSVIQVNVGADVDKDGVLVVSDSAGAGFVPPGAADKLEKKIHRAQFLLETARILASPKTLDRVLWDAAEKSKEALGDTAFIFLLEDSELRFHSAVSTNPDLGPQILKSLVNESEIVRTELQNLIQNAAAVLIADLSKVEPRELGCWTQQFGFKSMIAAPIKKDDEIYGVFITFSSAPNEFDESQLVLSTEFAEAMARTISHAKTITHLEQKANTDALTGLYNKRFFHEILLREVARAERHRVPLALLMLDMDDFKRVNDAYGHIAGDDALESLASILQSAVRREDFVFRYGGDEFGIVLPDTDLQGGAHVGEHIRNRVETSDLVPAAGLKGMITVSIGVSEYEAGLGCEMLVKRADDALLEAKKSGKKNNVRVYRAAASQGQPDSPSSQHDSSSGH